MAVRFDFECQKGHTFTLWSDDARCCPICQNEYLKRVFLEPVGVVTPKTHAVDNLVRRELENRGITNIQGGGHEGEREKITYKTTPAELAAAKIEKDFPAMKDKRGLELADQQIKQRWSQIGVKGIIKANVPADPLIKSLMPVGTHVRGGKIWGNPQFAPNNLGVRDRVMVQRQRIKDPENLKLKKG